MASRPAPLVSRRPQPSNGPVGGTSLGTPLKTRTVTAMPSASPQSASTAAAASAGTPQRARPAATSATPAGSPAATRTPAKAAGSSSSSVRGFGSSVASTAGPAGSPSASAGSKSAAAAAASPAPPAKMLSRQRYDAAKLTDPFSSKTKFKTSFSEAYVNGRIPCRINHGTTRHTLQWDRPSSELDFGFLIPVAADGLRETEHPYVVIARQAFAELLAEAGQARVAPLLPQLVQPIRKALMDENAGVFVAACTGLQQLSAAVGPLLNPHIDLLLQQVHKKAMKKETADLVNDTIQCLASNGGDESIPIIKKRVPGFVA